MGNIVGHGLIDYVVVAIFILYAVYAGFTKTHRILYILPAAVSFFFFIEVGPRLTPDKLVPTIFLISVIIRYGWDYFKLPFSPRSYWIFAVFIMIIYSFFIGSFVTMRLGDFIISPHLSNRIFIQIIGYLNAIFIFIIVRRECLIYGKIDILLRSFVATTSLLVVYGVYQFFADEYGLPYRGIVYSASQVGNAKVYSGGDTLFRVNSFANEPKRLSYFMVIGVLILVKYKNYFLNKWGVIRTLLMIVCHLLVLWWTYSTSIYLSIAVFLSSLFIYSVAVSYNKRLLNTLFFIGLLSVAAYFYQQKELENLYEVRVGTQLENEEIRAEVKGGEYLLKYPGYFVLGIGPGMYNFALALEYPGEAGLSPSGRILIPFNMAFLTYLYDFGIIGVFILVIPLFRLIFLGKNRTNQLSIFIFFLYCVCMTLDPTPTLFMMLGAFDAEDLIKV